MEHKISRSWKDIIQKYVSALFKDTTLEFYGVKTAKIKGLASESLPVVEVRDSSSDQIFELEDDTYLHLAFQTGKKEDDLIRHLEYDVRLYARDSKKISTVIIYSSDVTAPPQPLDIGSAVYEPIVVMLNGYDGDAIYADLDAKIKAGMTLSDLDIIKLIFLFMMKVSIPKIELAVNTIKMANTIFDENKREACVAAATSYANQFLNDKEMEKFMEVVKMFDMIARNLAEVFGEDRAKEVAKRMLKRGTAINIVTEDTGLDISKVIRIKEELENSSEPSGESVVI